MLLLLLSCSDKTTTPADTSWPDEGRVVAKDGESGTQVHVDDDVAFWRGHNGFTDTETTWSDGVLSCTAWSDCTGAAEVNVCTHSGGHVLVDGWVDREVAWMLQFSR